MSSIASIQVALQHVCKSTDLARGYSPGWTKWTRKLKSRNLLQMGCGPKGQVRKIFGLIVSRTQVYPWAHGGVILHRPLGQLRVFTKDFSNTLAAFRRLAFNSMGSCCYQPALLRKSSQCLLGNTTLSYLNRKPQANSIVDNIHLMCG